jgi:hypothetical protein
MSKEASPVKWDIHQFEKAYKEAVFQKESSIEVPAEFFDTLRAQYLAGEPADSFTYGKPGVRVFREGTKDAILDEGDLEVDEWTKIQAKKNPKIKEKRR